MRHIGIFSLISVVIGVLCGGVPAAAVSPDPKGLALSPPRQSITANAGTSATYSVTAANFTDKTLQVSLSVQEFTVSDYSYTYQFRMPQESWIKFSEPQFILEPRKTKTIRYALSPPKDAAPGGKYYTVTASAPVRDGQLTTNIQVATPLYIAVGGKTTRSSQLIDHSITRVAFGNKVPFSLDVKNTGNVHYNITTTARLTGLFTDTTPVSNTHILLPGTIRHIESTLPTPLLPGIYQATYGYETEYSSDPVLLKAYVLYTPPWLYAALILAVWGVVYIFRRKNIQSNKHTE